MSIKSCALSLFWLFLTVRSFITEDQSLGSFRMPKLALFMTVSENSLFIANASVIHQYDVRKGTIIRMYHDVRNLVAITASSRSILFGANSTTIFAWSTTNGTTIATLKSTKTVKSITSDQKENLLYITADVNIIQWRLGSEVSILPFQINNVTQLYLSDVYLIIHSSNEILVWNTQTKTGRKRRIVAGPNSIAIQKNSILVDEKINDEFVLCLYELKSMTRRPKNINYPIRRARLLAMAIMNDTIFLGTGDLSIHKMNLTSGAYLGELRGHRSAVVQLIAGQKLFSRGSRFQTKIWDPLTTSANATKPYDTSEKARFFVDTCQAIRFLYEKLFVLCSNRIQIFIPAFGTREQSSIISTGAKFTAISSDENFLYAGKSNGEILVYNGTTNHLVKSWRPFITKIIGLERYRDKLFVSSSSGTFAIDATTGAQIYQIHRSELNLLDMELREPYLFIATQEGIVIQHDISRNAEVRRWNSSLPLKLFCLTEDRILLDSGEEYNTTSGSLIAHWTIGKARYLACTSDYVFYGKNNSINQYRRSDKSLVNVLDGHAGPVVAAVGTSIGLISLGTLEAIIWEVPPKSQEKQIFDWINDEEDEEDDDDYRAADDGLLPANDGNAQLPATSIDTEPSIQVLEDYSDNIEFIEPGTLVETQSNLPFSTEWIPVSSQSFPVVEITQGKNSDTISDIKQSNKIFGLTMELFAIIGTFMAAVVFISIIVAIYVYLRWKKKKIKTESRMELFCRHDGINNTIDETSMTLTSTATASTMATLSKSLVDLSQPTLISEFSIPLNEFHGKTKWTRRDLALETDHVMQNLPINFRINIGVDVHPGQLSYEDTDAEYWKTDFVDSPMPRNGLYASQAAMIYYPKYPDTLTNARERKEYFNHLLVTLNLFQSHPFVCKIFGYSEDPPALILKFYPAGNLTMIVQSRTKAMMWKILHDVTQALKMIHSLQYAHLNIKSTSVWIEHNPRFNVSLFNFQRCQSIDQILSFHLQMNNYTAPELANPGALSIGPGPKSWLLASDVFSTGGLLFFMLTGREPWDHNCN